MIERNRSPYGGGRELGYAVSDSEPILLNDPDRKGHLHILGAPDQGKSRFIYSQLCADIEQGLGACLLDPNGGTAKAVLKYAVSRGFENIIYIDTKDFKKFNAWPTLNPLLPKAPTEAVITTFMDSVRNVWEQKDASSTGNINKYLESLIFLLHRGGYTLHESLYFLSGKRYEYWRNIIFSHVHELNENRAIIEDAFADKYLFKDFQTTINRLKPFFQGSLRNVFASKVSPISFQNLLDRRAIILVTMEASEIGQLAQRLLGTVILNYLIRAKERREGDTTPYYVYIDEVGQFATGKLAFVLDHNRHIGMRMIMAHQRYEQLGPHESAIKSAQTKILFYTAEDDDRLKSVKMMFGGEISDRDSSAYAKTLKKQQAIVAIGKQTPKTVRFHDAVVPEISRKELDDFKRQFIYNQNINPFYRSYEQVKEEIKNRFAKSKTTRGNYADPKPAPKAHDPAPQREPGHDQSPVHETLPVDSGPKRPKPNPGNSGIPTEPPPQSVVSPQLPQRPGHSQADGKGRGSKANPRPKE
jgi:hypothetical protein